MSVSANLMRLRDVDPVASPRCSLRPETQNGCSARRDARARLRFGARASVVSNNLNHLMKQLMLVTIALMLPTLVFSLFGMNVKLPIEPEQGYLGFWIVMIIASASGVGVLAMWRYKKW